MSRFALVSVALLVTTLASGCSGNSQNETSSAPPEFQTVQATPDTGVIRGIVVTSSITPIPDATVKLNGAGNVTKKTTASGAFVFDGLKPGTYFMTASKLGFTSVQASSTVVAGDDAPAVVKIQLTEDSVNRPFAEMLSWKGFLTCSFSVGAGGVGLGGDICPAETGEEFIHDFPFSSGIPTFSQSEMVWVSTQTLSKTLQLGYYLGGTTDWKLSGGESPITLNTTHDEIAAKAPQKANSTTLTERVFPAYPSAGAVVVTNQDFQVYTTHFYNFKPHAGWTFVKEGACTNPEQCG